MIKQLLKTYLNNDSSFVTSHFILLSFVYQYNGQVSNFQLLVANVLFDMDSKLTSHNFNHTHDNFIIWDL